MPNVRVYIYVQKAEHIFIVILTTEIFAYYMLLFLE